MLEELVGRSVAVVVDEGSGPFAAALKLLGRVASYRSFQHPPELGRAGIYQEVVLDVAEPKDDRFRDRVVSVSIRYEGASFEDVLHGKEVIVNIALSDANHAYLAGGIGGLRLLE